MENKNFVREQLEKNSLQILSLLLKENLTHFFIFSKNLELLPNYLPDNPKYLHHYTIKTDHFEIKLIANDQNYVDLCDFYIDYEVFYFSKKLKLNGAITYYYDNEINLIKNNFLNVEKQMIAFLKS